MRINPHMTAVLGSLCLLSASPAGVGEIDPLRDSLGDGRRLAIIAKAVGIEEGIQDFEWQQERHRKRLAAVGRVPGPDEIVISTGGRGWDVRVDVILVAHGDFEPQRMDIWGSAHYGKPDFSDQSRHWFIDVKDTTDGFEEQRSYPAYRSHAGEWYVCPTLGWDSPNPSDGFSPPEPQAVDFDTPAQVDLEQAVEFTGPGRQEIIDMNYPAPFWSNDGTTARCHSGLRATEFAGYLSRTTWRKAILHEHCALSLAHTVAQDPTPAEEDAAREQGIPIVSNNALGIRYDYNAVQACVDRLYPSGWPYTD